MRIEYLAVKGFRNIVELELDWGADMIAILGRNGAGKSNVLEVLLEIFDGLYRQRATRFDYTIRYRRGEDQIEIRSLANASPSQREFTVGGERKTADTFYEVEYSSDEMDTDADEDAEPAPPIPLDQLGPYLPARVFLYRAGRSRPLDQTFWVYRRHYLRGFEELNAYGDPNLPRLFRARREHAEFALLVALTLGTSSIRAVLEEHLSITGLHSCRFSFRQLGGSEGDGPETLGGRPGQLLRWLKKQALHPTEETFEQSIRFDESYEFELQHLRLSGEQLLELIERRYTRQGLKADALFRDFEALATLGAIHDVCVRVVQRGACVRHLELSEGELQFITLLGLLLATNQNGSLILLDEPDTHLNPRWAQSFVRWLGQAQAGMDVVSQLVFASNNPLTISGFDREQIVLLEGDADNGVRARRPHRSPKGMGINNVLTSEYYELDSALDLDTQKSLERRRELEHPQHKLSPEEKKELRDLQDRHWEDGLYYPDRDPVRKRIERVLVENPELRHSTANVDERERLAEELLARFAAEGEG